MFVFGVLECWDVKGRECGSVGSLASSRFNVDAIRLVYIWFALFALDCVECSVVVWRETGASWRLWRR